MGTDESARSWNSGPSKQSMLGLHRCSGVSVAKDALSQVCMPTSMSTGVLRRPTLPPLRPFPDLPVPRGSTRNKTRLKVLWTAPARHGWYHFPDVTVNSAQLSVLMAKDSTLLTDYAPVPLEHSVKTVMLIHRILIFCEKFFPFGRDFTSHKKMTRC